MYYLDVYLITSLEVTQGEEDIKLTPEDLQIIETRLGEDYTNVRGIFKYTDGLTVVNIQYQGNYIFRVLLSKNTPFTDVDAKNLQDEIDLGPDTWMEGNIVIFEKDEEEWELFVDIYGYGEQYFA